MSDRQEDCDKAYKNYQKEVEQSVRFALWEAWTSGYIAGLDKAQEIYTDKNEPINVVPLEKMIGGAKK